MASYSFLAPRPTNAILSDVDHIREIQWVLAQWNPSLADDAPEDSKRLVPLDSAKTQYRFERLVGSSWNSVGKLMHDVDTLDGYHASTSAVKNTIPVYNADAKLVGDLTGNANTATTLKNIRKLQIGGIASGGSVNFDGSADATIEITQLTVNNANDTAINGILTIKHGGTGASDAATARTQLGVPAINHASADKSFGVATTSVYGHAIGSDNINATFTADKGYFFSPKGANDLRAALDAELANKLDLSGGTMNGPIFTSVMDILTSTQNDLYLNFNGGTNYNAGATLTIYGKDNASTPGWAVLRASDGNLSNQLVLQPSGRASVGGKAIITEAGGTMTGALKKDGGDVLLNANTYGAMFLCGGTTRADGSYIMLKPKQHSNNAGEMSLVVVAADGTSKELNLQPGRNPRWGNSEILTSAGGTMTGALSFGISNNLLVYNDDTVNHYKYILLQAGEWDKGARILLMRDDSTNDSGVLVLHAGTTDFRIKPDGTAYLQQSPILTSAGGTVNGNFEWVRGSIYGEAGIYAGMTMNGNKSEPWAGSTFVARAPDAQDPDSVSMIARRPGVYHEVVLRPDGSFIKDGQHILTIVTSWSDANGNWYRKYSDGWIEQGGVSDYATDKTITLTFPTAFSSTNYTVTLGNIAKGARHFLRIGTKTTTTMQLISFSIDGTFAVAGNWYACGY
jgi:hypothetical protein